MGGPNITAICIPVLIIGMGVVGIILVFNLFRSKKSESVASKFLKNTYFLSFSILCIILSFIFYNSMLIFQESFVSFVCLFLAGWIFILSIFGKSINRLIWKDENRLNWKYGYLLGIILFWLPFLWIFLSYPQWWVIKL